MACVSIVCRDSVRICFPRSDGMGSIRWIPKTVNDRDLSLHNLSRSYLAYNGHYQLIRKLFLFTLNKSIDPNVLVI